MAVLGAVVMVATAMAVRQSLDDDGDGGTDDPAGATVIVCAEDLLEACEASGADVEVRAAPAATTAGALADGSLDEDVDAWVTTTAWVEVVEARTPDALGGPRALATSPAVVATAPGRFEAIEALCADDDVWACLGDAAGSDWGDLGDGTHPEWRELKVGLTDPDSATGLSGLASAAVGFFGDTDFAANDPDFAEFEGWLATVAGPSAGGDPNPARTLATRPGTYSAGGSTAATAEGFAVRGVEVIAPSTEVRATVVIVAIGDQRAPEGRPIRDALVAAGWTGASEADLAPTLKPGVMAALHTLWRAVTR